MSTDVWLLMSGGVDSTACGHYFKQRGDRVTGVFVDYGQLAAGRERMAAEKVTEHLGLELKTLSFRASRSFDVGEIIGRNAFLIFSAMMGVEMQAGILSLGIHAGTGYYDCGTEFIRSIGEVVDAYSAGKLALHCPFVHVAKGFVYNYAKAEGIPLHLTYSCELGTTPPCGTCRSCKDRHEFQAR